MSANGMIDLDFPQVIRSQAVRLADGSVSQQVSIVSGLAPSQYDNIALTYIAAGNPGAGEIHTVAYSLSGIILNVLTLAYGADGKLINVTRT